MRRVGGARGAGSTIRCFAPRTARSTQVRRWYEQFYCDVADIASALVEGCASLRDSIDGAVAYP